MKNIKEAISIIEKVRKYMPECAHKAFLKGALNELNEAVNSHEKLMEALKNALQIMIQTREHRKANNVTGGNVFLSSAIEEATQALKSCE